MNEQSLWSNIALLLCVRKSLLSTSVVHSMSSDCVCQPIHSGKCLSRCGEEKFPRGFSNFRKWVSISDVLLGWKKSMLDMFALNQSLVTTACLTLWSALACKLEGYR